ncbi:MAG: ABC transporter ATP-binding protein [Deltaproteobacteria bacterium]|nr:ABC transporter ATP-binding protein [Deltaproteobacteria bacterium]
MTIVARHVIKEFGSSHTRVLHDLDVTIADGEFVSISGRSGAGKSTLLYLLSTLDHPNHGEIIIDGETVRALSVRALHAFRCRHVGFIFQFHYLLPELTALENVLLAPRNVGLLEEKRPQAMALLEQFDIVGEKDKFPAQMSGGQQQRVAIARALIMNPRYIFADEPTGNLDTVNGMKVMQILQEVHRRDRTTIILVTHEPDYAAMASREIDLCDGRLVSDVRRGVS